MQFVSRPDNRPQLEPGPVSHPSKLLAPGLAKAPGPAHLCADEIGNEVRERQAFVNSHVFCFGEHIGWQRDGYVLAGA
jgi:hypothetical protein